MKKKALIFGVTGQDGSYLSEFLLGKDMKFELESLLNNFQRIDHIIKILMKN